MAFKDHFSGIAEAYSRYRPQYPDAMFAHLAGLTSGTGRAWDCATGGGQAALLLANHFESVVATDASAQQVKQAAPHPRITYGVAPAEKSGLNTSSVDLINVAQAVHWFSLDAFYTEVRRIAAPGAILALSSYGLLRISPEVDRLVDHFYKNVVGAFWPPERDLVEEKYETLPFPFQVIPMPPFPMSARWSCNHLIGYLSTWSATKRCWEEQGEDPVTQMIEPLLEAWRAPADTEREAQWELIFKVARVDSFRG